MQTDIRTLVSDFTTQLEQTIRRMALEQVLEALGGGATPARRGSGRPRKTAAARPAVKGGKRTSASLDEMQAALLAHVKSHPGQGAIEIADALKTDVGTMRLPMQKLLAERKVRTQGQRRGTKYFAAGGGSGPARPKAVPAAKKKAGKGGRKAKASGPKAEVVEVAAAA
jgi:hypothetical protein